MPSLSCCVLVVGDADDVNYSAHGFATRCDLKDSKQKAAFERCKDSAVSWFIQHLH